MAFAFGSGPALACERDPFLFQLPGETEADANERSDNVRAAFRAIEHANRESYAVQNSTLIYLARVVLKTPGRSTSAERNLPSTRVRPLASLKGTFASADRTLTDEAASGMCTDIGDGQGALSGVGKLVVVFEGLPKTSERPRGIDSFEAGSIRTVPLLDWLRGHGKDLEN